jgi:hypothetical protein
MNDLCVLRRLGAALFSFTVFALAWGPTARAFAPAPVPRLVTKRTEVGKNVLLEVTGKERRVIVKSVVVLREGALEGLLTRTMTKEYEYILAADCDARHIHLALTLAGANNGSPVEFLPKYRPAEGGPIKISLRYKKNGKLITVSARDWVREHKGKKPLDLDWVFTGSRFVPHPEGMGKPPIYLANQGDLICLCNMGSALLDLPTWGPKSWGERLYEAHTDRVPAKGTPVDVIFEPVPEKKGKP